MQSNRGLELFSLNGKTALVTGASRGIGAAIATGFASAGADVAVLARSKADLESVAEGLRSLGHQALVVACDVTNSEAVRASCELVRQEFGRIDILVNNAGGPMFQSHFLEVRENGWDKVINLNLSSVYRFSREVGRGMVAAGGGSIINVASLAHNVWPTVAPYLAAKAAVLNLTESLAVEWGGHAVRVNALCPGAVDTDINRTLAHNADLRDLAVSLIPLARWAQPEDMVGTAIWLASDASRYVTGAIVAVDGGLLLSAPKDWLTRLDRALGTDPGATDG